MGKETKVYGGTLNSGIQYEVHEVSGFGSRSEIAIIINNKPVQVIEVNENKKENRLEITSIIKNRVFVDIPSADEKLDDVIPEKPKTTAKTK